MNAPTLILADNTEPYIQLAKDRAQDFFGTDRFTFTVTKEMRSWKDQHGHEHRAWTGRYFFDAELGNHAKTTRASAKWGSEGGKSDG